jgi:hypothetical protein
MTLKERVVEQLDQLPPERLQQVADYLALLEGESGTPVGESLDQERDDLYRLGIASFAHAYGENEPDYEDVPLVKVNPDYVGG